MAKKFADRFQKFKEECKAINLRYEYSGYQGEAQWAIVTELSREELLEKYPEVMEEYTPCVLLSVEQGEVIKDFKRNEHKHEVRGKKYHDAYDAGDGGLEIRHRELIQDTLLEEVIFRIQAEELREAIRDLDETQRRRLTKFFFAQKSIREIAEEEGVHHSTVSKSIRAAVKALKKYMV